MTYGFVVDVPGPVALYDELHAEVVRRSPRGADGLIVHLGRATDTGFQVIEVWETQEQCDRFNAEVVEPAMAELFEAPPPSPPPPRVEFEPRGLIVPAADVLV